MRRGSSPSRAVSHAPCESRRCGPPPPPVWRTPPQRRRQPGVAEGPSDAFAVRLHARPCRQHDVHAPCVALPRLHGQRRQREPQLRRPRSPIADSRWSSRSRLAADGLLRCCDPVWICSLGCRVASNRCMLEADRRQARCAREISASCASSAECRRGHLTACAAQTDRSQCMASSGSCTSCCYIDREGAFGPLGINQCVAKEHSIGTQTPTSSSAGGQIVH